MAYQKPKTIWTHSPNFGRPIRYAELPGSNCQGQVFHRAKNSRMTLNTPHNGKRKTKNEKPIVPRQPRAVNTKIKTLHLSLVRRP